MKNVFELLESASLTCPERLLFEDVEGVNYRDALSKVSSVACYLWSKGIRKQRILVNVGRDFSTLLLFFGIALSGNCYVPMDPTYPEQRKKDIVDIGEVAYGFDCPELESLSAKEAFSFPINEADILEMKAAFNAEDPLYLMFTSGSTGKPKGVMKCHRNVLAFVDNFVSTFGLEEGVRICNQTPFSFDASAKDIYLTLKLKGTLYIPDKTKFALPKVIVDYLNEKQVDTILWVPSALTVIAKTRTLNYIKPEYLKRVFFIGEVFPAKYLNMWIAAMPDTHFVNLYGSTEIAGACLYHEVKGELPIDASLPTGKPLHGNEVKLEDGEICVCSDQVALGYYNDPEKTASTFRVEDGKRFLHTGDFAEINDDGDIVFHARKDFQIKHMGYRIELQDIEAVMSSLDYVEDCCCLYNQDKGKIVLFVTLNRELENAVTVISNDAREKLPYYMVPNIVRVLPVMPLNANGKIDRNGLKKSL